MRRIGRIVDAHFEIGFVAYLWLNVSVLAAVVGRPYLGAIGFVTVLPFLLLYLLRARKGGSAEKKPGME